MDFVDRVDLNYKNHNFISFTNKIIKYDHYICKICNNVFFYNANNIYYLIIDLDKNDFFGHMFKTEFTCEEFIIKNIIE